MCTCPSFGTIGVLQLAEHLNPLDVFLGLMAAAAHDVDHPGVNQPFLIKTRHHLASLYQVHTGVPICVSFWVNMSCKFAVQTC